MENAFSKGTVKAEDLTGLSNPDFITYWIEAVYKKVQKFKVFNEVLSDDIELKYCCFCGRKL